MGKKSSILAGALALFAACDGGPSGPPGGGGGIEGTYRGDHRLVLNIGGVPFELRCTGSVVIIDVQGESLQGTMTIDASQDCGAPATSTISGTLRSNGTITFAASDQGALAEQFEEELGCDVTRTDEAFSGTLRQGELDAIFTLSAQCQAQGSVDVEWRVDMAKVS